MANNLTNVVQNSIIKTDKNNHSDGRYEADRVGSEVKQMGRIDWAKYEGVATTVLVFTAYGDQPSGEIAMGKPVTVTVADGIDVAYVHQSPKLDGATIPCDRTMLNALVANMRPVGAAEVPEVNVSKERNWTWIKFDARPGLGVRIAMHDLGAHWSGKRSAWYVERLVNVDEVAACGVSVK